MARGNSTAKRLTEKQAKWQYRPEPLDDSELNDWDFIQRDAKWWFRKLRDEGWKAAEYDEILSRLGMVYAEIGNSHNALAEASPKTYLRRAFTKAMIKYRDWLKE